MKLKHYLIATEENDYTPWIITPTALAVFCLVIWSIRLIVPNSFTMAAAGMDATDLMNRINNERTQRFLTALVTNQKLIVAANGKADDMITRSYFAHVDPDGNYVWPRIVAAGFSPYSTLGENLAMDYTSASGVVKAWMDSPTHRANIVNEKFEEQGLASLSGLYEPNHETIMTVSLFGTLMKSKATPPPPPAAPAPTPTPTPTPSPTPTPTPTPNPTASPIQISDNVKISKTVLSGQAMIDVTLTIVGQPTLVTAQLNSQSITLIASKETSGQYLGTFTFNQTEDLANTTLRVEARDKAGAKTNFEYPINLPAESAVAGNEPVTIPVSNDAQIIKILRIIFGILAIIYLGFLIIDAIIIRRAQIQRPGAHSNPHLLVFALVAAVTLFSNWF